MICCLVAHCNSFRRQASMQAATCCAYAGDMCARADKLAVWWPGRKVWLLATTGEAGVPALGNAVAAGSSAATIVRLSHCSQPNFAIDTTHCPFHKGTAGILRRLL